jgi:GTP pyrophosphokinase
LTRRKVRVTPLKERRLERGLTCEQVALALGVTRQAVSAWERGVHRPSFKHLHKLAYLYDTNIWQVRDWTKGETS